MFRRKRLGRNLQSEESSGHHDRPWVYFMVDCFFLVTQFYVATFHVKATENILPQKLPPGGPGKTPPNSNVESLYVHVSNEGGHAVYRIKDVPPFGADVLAEKLAGAARAKPGDVIVRVSYDADVQWEDTMAVFNNCKKAGINQCGLIPLRSDKAGH